MSNYEAEEKETTEEERPKTLAEFLAKRDIGGITQIINVPSIPFPMKIKAMKKSEMDNYAKQVKVKSDSLKVNDLILLNHLIEPDLSNASLLATLRVSNPLDAIDKVFSAGEYLTIIDKISELSGFNTDLTDKINTVKN